MAIINVISVAAMRHRSILIRKIYIHKNRSEQKQNRTKQKRQDRTEENKSICLRGKSNTLIQDIFSYCLIGLHNCAFQMFFVFRIFLFVCFFAMQKGRS